MVGERGTEQDAVARGWNILERVALPGGSEMTLREREGAYEIFVDDGDLMSSDVHGSEESQARFGCRNLRRAYMPRVLVGGLGFGYTLAAVLRELPPSATVVVAERVPEVVKWNHGVLGGFAGRPLDDPRVEVCIQDVAELLAEEEEAFDAILLDVDNGPFAPSIRDNRRLYSTQGLEMTLGALRRDGVLVIWSSTPDAPFQRQLRHMGLHFRTQEVSSGLEEIFPSYLHIITNR